MEHSYVIPNTFGLFSTTWKHLVPSFHKLTKMRKTGSFVIFTSRYPEPKILKLKALSSGIDGLLVENQTRANALAIFNYSQPLFPIIRN